MIFAQHGPAWKPKIEKFLKEKLIDGVIWDPREESVDRIKEIRSNDENYSLCKNIIDLKVYYKQFPNSIPKKLDELEYFPMQNIDRAFLRNTENLESLVEKSVKFQLDFGVDALLSPSFYLYSFNERIVDKLFDVWEIFDEYLKNKNMDQKKIVSIIFNESALENSQYMEDFLDDFSVVSNKFDGIYITIDRELNYSNRHDFNPSRLSNLLQFIYDLKNFGLKVIIGYSGMESILYLAVGTDIIGTGWFYNLRRFNRVDKGLEPADKFGRAKKRYTSLKMLYELAIEEQIFSIPDNMKNQLYQRILSGCKLDEKIIKGNIELISFNDVYEQYFESLKHFDTMIGRESDIETRLKIVNQMLNDAEKNISSYNNSVILQKVSDKHIKSYKSALSKFVEENFIQI